METDQRRVGQDVRRHLGEHWGTFYFHWENFKRGFYWVHQISMDV